MAEVLNWTQTNSVTGSRRANQDSLYKYVYRSSEDKFLCCDVDNSVGIGASKIDRFAAGFDVVDNYATLPTAQAAITAASVFTQPDADSFVPGKYTGMLWGQTKPAGGPTGSRTDGLQPHTILCVDPETDTLVDIIGSTTNPASYGANSARLSWLFEVQKSGQTYVIAIGKASGGTGVTGGGRTQKGAAAYSFDGSNITFVTSIADVRPSAEFSSYTDAVTSAIPFVLPNDGSGNVRILIPINATTLSPRLDNFAMGMVLLTFNGTTITTTTLFCLNETEVDAYWGYALRSYNYHYLGVHGSNLVLGLFADTGTGDLGRGAPSFEARTLPGFVRVWQNTMLDYTSPVLFPTYPGDDLESSFPYFFTFVEDLVGNDVGILVNKTTGVAAFEGSVSRSTFSGLGRCQVYFSSAEDFGIYFENQTTLFSHLGFTLPEEVVVNICDEEPQEALILRSGPVNRIMNQNQGILATRLALLADKDAVDDMAVVFDLNGNSFTNLAAYGGGANEIVTQT